MNNATRSQRNNKNNRRYGRNVNKPIPKSVVSATIHNDLNLVNTKRNAPGLRSRLAPESRIIKMKFQSENVTQTSSGNGFSVKVYIGNGLYDPDPSLLTSSFAGFNQNMAFYSYYTVLKNKFKVVYANREAFPVKVCIGTFPDDPGPIGSSVQNVIDLGEQPQTTPWRELSAAGGQDRATLQIVTSYPHFIGHEIFYHASDYFYGTPSTNPITPIFQASLMYGTDNFTSAGVAVSVSMTVTAKLFYRRIVLDSGPQLKPIKIKIAELDVKMQGYETRLSILDPDDPSYGATRDSLIAKIKQTSDKIAHYNDVLLNPMKYIDPEPPKM